MPPVGRLSRKARLFESRPELDERLQQQPWEPTVLSMTDDGLQNQRVNSAVEAARSLARGMAHDINNVLQVVQGFTELLLAGDKSTDVAETLLNIVRAAEVGRELTQGLLAFSRPVPTPPDLVDVNELVHELRDLIAPTLPRGVMIDVHLSNTLKPVRAQRCQLQQVAMNLILNARDAMPNGGRLTIETEAVLQARDRRQCPVNAAGGEYVRLSVADNGGGMDLAAMQHLYEPFFTTKPTGRGTGLGLSIVHGVVTSLGGSVECHSRPGHGTVFHVLLPASSGGAMAAAFGPDIEPRKVDCGMTAVDE